MAEAPHTPSNTPLGLLRLPAPVTCVYSCPWQGQLDLWQCPGVTQRRIQLLAHTVSRGHHQARLLFLKVGTESFPNLQRAWSGQRPLGLAPPPDGGLATPASLPQLPMSFKVPHPTGLPSHCPWSLSPSSFSPVAPPWRLSCLFRAAGPGNMGRGSRLTPLTSASAKVDCPASSWQCPERSLPSPRAGPAPSCVSLTTARTSRVPMRSLHRALGIAQDTVSISGSLLQSRPWSSTAM